MTSKAPSPLASTARSVLVGDVWGDPVMQTTDNVTINHVFFAPGGRTNWHTHPATQTLHVLTGVGRLQEHVPRFAPAQVSRSPRKGKKA